MTKTSRTFQSGKYRKPSVRKHTSELKILQLRKKIDWALRGGSSCNPCVIKHCPAKQGFGVFARRNLKKGVCACYYATKLVRLDAPSPTKAMYWTSAPSSPINPNRTSQTFGGDIGQHAGDVFGRYVFRGKPVCGHLINEPGKDEIENCSMLTTVWDASLLKEGAGKSRTVFKEGDLVFWEMKTLCAVKKGEELVTVYGDDYERNYTRGKKFSQKKK